MACLPWRGGRFPAETWPLPSRCGPEGLLPPQHPLSFSSSHTYLLYFPLEEVVRNSYLELENSFNFPFSFNLYIHVKLKCFKKQCHVWYDPIIGKCKCIHPTVIHSKHPSVFFSPLSCFVLDFLLRKFKKHSQHREKGTVLSAPSFNNRGYSAVLSHSSPSHTLSLLAGLY